MKNDSYWEQDEFEDYIASSMIAMYEEKLVKDKGITPCARVRDKDLKMFRQMGPYIPGWDRLIIAPDPNGNCFYDRENDGLVTQGCVGMIKTEDSYSDDQLKGYFHNTSFRRVKSLPKGWISRAPGALYMGVNFVAQNKGYYARRHYFTVTRNGQIVAADINIPSRSYGPNCYGEKAQIISYSDCEPHLLPEAEFNFSMAIQYCADAKYCWSIRAEEAKAKVTLGCQKEEVKSLLYARSLPMTATGRKRPVLHLVEAHKRRLKNGIDVDVTAFLRGQQTVEMDGTIFTVRPPSRQTMPELSENSDRYYEQSA